MGIKSGGYNATMAGVPQLKYWAMLAAIRRIMRDVPYPAVVDVMDALMEPAAPTQHALDGKRIYPSRGMGGTR